MHQRYRHRQYRTDRTDNGPIAHGEPFYNHPKMIPSTKMLAWREFQLIHYAYGRGHLAKFLVAQAQKTQT